MFEGAFTCAIDPKPSVGSGFIGVSSRSTRSKIAERILTCSDVQLVVMQNDLAYWYGTVSTKFPFDLHLASLRNGLSLPTMVEILGEHDVLQPKDIRQLQWSYLYLQLQL